MPNGQESSLCDAYVLAYPADTEECVFEYGGQCLLKKYAIVLGNCGRNGNSQNALILDARHRRALEDKPDLEKPKSWWQIF